MACCNSEEVIEVDHDSVRVANDRSVEAEVEYGEECSHCGDRSCDGSVTVAGRFKHACRKRAALGKDALHYSVSEVGEPEELGSLYPSFKLPVSIECNGCGAVVKLVLEGQAR